MLVKIMALGVGGGILNQVKMNIWIIYSLQKHP